MSSPKCVNWATPRPYSPLTATNNRVPSGEPAAWSVSVACILEAAICPSRSDKQAQAALIVMGGDRHDAVAGDADSSAVKGICGRRTPSQVLPIHELTTGRSPAARLAVQVTEKGDDDGSGLVVHDCVNGMRGDKRESAGEPKRLERVSSDGF